jgi:predicted enzyme related to lactoylglutathione lyase
MPMPDPFEALRTAPTPIDPDPAFAARLRARVFRALLASQGDLNVTLQATDTANRLRQGDISFLSLWVADVQRASMFFSSVLGWTYTDNGPGDSRQVNGLAISHGISELRSAGDFMRRLGVPLPAQIEPTAYAVHVVDNINASVERVRAAGGWAGAPLQQPYGLVAACLDDQAMPFTLHEVPAGLPAPRPPATGGRHGDVAYLVFETPDSTRARAFLGSVFGLQFAPGRSGDGWNIPEMVPMSGLSGGHARATIVPMYRVDNIQAAVERVRAAGGTSTDPVVEPYGTRAECVDDQGTRFMLGQF